MAGNTSKNRDASRRNFRTPNPNELTVENSVLVSVSFAFPARVRKCQCST
jgi:hypothetical protein